MKSKKDDNFIQKAVESMEEKGTEGKFSAKAKRAGMSVKKYADKVIKDLKGKTNGDKSKVKLLRQAIFARNMMKINK